MFFTSLTEWTAGNVMIRILTALVLGGAIGIDRGVKRRGGGARTDAAVCLGAALVMLTAQYMTLHFPDTVNLSRMPAQVISGVGFLGAGSIIVSRRQIKGLTSAASIWICACVGLAAGIGFIDGAAVVTAVLLAGLHILPVIEDRLYQYFGYIALYIEAEDSKTAAFLLHKMKMDGCKIDMYEVDKPGAGGQTFTIMATIRVARGKNREEYLDELSGTEGIISLDSL